MSRIAAIILAAGRSTRFGETPKVLAALDGEPLVRHVAEAALASRARPVLVVVGPAAERVRAALNDLEVEIVPAADFEKGLSHSLRAGLASVPQEADGAVVLLADMPRVSPKLIDHLIDSFAAAEQPSAVVPVYRNRRGNPVVLGRKLFAAASALEGDVGARAILGPDAILCLVDDEAVSADIDTQEDLRRLSTLARGS
ncbi:MAG: nucleotidyltransferase family protein [Methylovirgula sp.]|nr:nucleotidyltransferase family protein [Methylovirgula sp.]